jgi:hypothetical protein
MKQSVLNETKRFNVVLNKRTCFGQQKRFKGTDCARGRFINLVHPI